MVQSRAICASELLFTAVRPLRRPVRARTTAKTPRIGTSFQASGAKRRLRARSLRSLTGADIYSESTLQLQTKARALLRL